MIRDLTVEEPRPMDATLRGYEWLPRMIDKAAAARTGTLGDYYRYPCPIDRTALDRLGIDADTFADIVERTETDDAVLDELGRVGIPTAAQAAFDPVTLNEELHSGGS